MKKLVLILILTLSWSVSNGQLYPPIQPYQENDYSISEVKVFALSQTKLSSSWRTELLNIVNAGLVKAGENVVVLDESSINWILDHVVYERRNLPFFENSRNIFEEVKFYPDSNFDGMVGVFKYGRCNLVVFKTKCMNLLKVPVQIIQVEPKPLAEPTVSTLSPKKMYEETINISLFFLGSEKQKKERTWFGRKWPWFAGVFVTSGLTVGGIYAYNHWGRHHINPIIIKPIEKRTMPPGIPSIPTTPTPTTPGIPSDPRTMPGGIGKSFSVGFVHSF